VSENKNGVAKSTRRMSITFASFSGRPAVRRSELRKSSLERDRTEMGMIDDGKVSLRWPQRAADWHCQGDIGVKTRIWS
jgi:hypothetical protein